MMMIILLIILILILTTPCPTVPATTTAAPIPHRFTPLVIAQKSRSEEQLLEAILIRVTTGAGFSPPCGLRLFVAMEH